MMIAYDYVLSYQLRHSTCVDKLIILLVTRLVIILTIKTLQYKLQWLGATDFGSAQRVVNVTMK